MDTMKLFSVNKNDKYLYKNTTTPEMRRKTY